MPENQQITLSARIAGVYFDRGQFRKSEQINQKNIRLLKESNSLHKKLGLLTIASVQPYMDLAHKLPLSGDSLIRPINMPAKHNKLRRNVTIPSAWPMLMPAWAVFMSRQGLFSTALFYLENNQRFCILAKPAFRALCGDNPLCKSAIGKNPRRVEG